MAPCARLQVYMQTEHELKLTALSDTVYERMCAPVTLDIALRVLDLVGALQGLVDALDHHGHAVGRVQALVRIDMPGCIGIPCHLHA